MAQKIAYELVVDKDWRRSCGEQYKDLTLYILLQDCNIYRGEEYYSYNRIGKFTWLGSMKDSKWFACNWENESHHSLANLDETMKFLSKVQKAQINWNTSPENLIQWLDGLRGSVGRVVYDSRISRHVPINEVEDPELMYYVDIRQDVDHVTVGVLAYNESDAKTKIAVKLAENEYFSVLSNWLKNEKPIKNTSEGYYGKSAPNIKLTEEILTLTN